MNATKLLPFSTVFPRCPKCGHKTDRPSIDFCEEGHAGQEQVKTIGMKQEHLDITCPRCGFTRLMRTYDDYSPTR